jgi:hypothetical protein
MKEIRFVGLGKLRLVVPPDAGRTTGKACCQRKTPEVFDRIERNLPLDESQRQILTLSNSIAGYHVRSRDGSLLQTRWERECILRIVLLLGRMPVIFRGLLPRPPIKYK